MSFYVYFKQDSLTPVSVSGQQIQQPDEGEIQIDDELGIKFIKGQENLTHYIVSFNDKGEPQLMKKTKESLTTFSRLPTLQLVELTREIALAPVQIHVDYKKQQVKIHYNSNVLKYNPFKLYFTKEDDPSYLICALHLDVNTLDEILKKNKLRKWPNPLVLNVPTDDLSVYSLKTNTHISIVKKNVKARNNRVRPVLSVL